MKKLFSRLLLLSLFTFLIMSVVTYNVNAQVKKSAKNKDVAISSPVQNQGIITNDIVKPVLPFTGPRSVTTCYPVNAARNTGSVDPSGTITQTSLIKAEGAVGSVTGQSGWIKFDISSLPPTGFITEIKLHIYRNASNYPYFYVNQVTSDPVTAPGSTLYSEITGAAGKYLNFTGSWFGAGWDSITLNGTANADVQALISTGWWAIGLFDYDIDPSTLWYFYADGWNETNKPYITVTTSAAAVVDAQTTALWMPTRVPQITFSPFSAQNIPLTAIVKNNGTGAATFDVDTRIYKSGVLDATNVSNVIGLAAGSSQTLTGSYTPTSSAIYNLSDSTKLTADSNPANDALHYPLTCAIGVNDTVFAWDDGVNSNSYGLTGGLPCWFGSTFTLSAPDTLTSATVMWGSFTGTLTGNAVELWNTSGGIPSTLHTTIASGITLTSANNNTWATYMAPAPVVLPAGTYFLAVHQTITLASNYIMAFDNGPVPAWTAVNSPRNISYYSGTGTTWSEAYSVSIYGFFMTRANFGMVSTAPSLSALPGSLNFGYIPYPGTSPTQTYSLSGINLTSGPIVVTAPTGFEVSLDGSTWFSTVNVTYSPPTLAPTTIHVHFKPLAANTPYSGNITNIGGGGSTNVAVSGTSALIYCSSGASNAADEEIFSVTVNGATNAYDCSTIAPGPGSILNRYSNFFPLGDLTNLQQGATISFTILEDECDGAPYYANGCAIWIDYNQNGIFEEPGEKVFVEALTTISPRTITGSFLVPAATLGRTAMRITVAEGQAGASLTPCLSYGYGETEDYYVNITAATGPLNPVAFTATPFNPSQIDLAFTPNASSNPVVIVWNNTGTFTIPSGAPPAIGQPFAGGTLIVNGLVSPYNHTSLTSNTMYYYKAFSYDGSAYSSGLTANALTPCSLTIAPWTENFEIATFPPLCWTKAQSNASYPWTRVTTASGYGLGTASAWVNFYNASGGTTMDLMTFPFDISSLPGAEVKFDHAYATYSGENDQLEILYSVNYGLNWTSLILYNGGTSGPLNTGGTVTSPFVPTANQWATKSVVLPAGTNMLKFHAISAYGNNLFVDNIKVLIPLANDVGTFSVDVNDVNPLGTVAPKATIKNFGTASQTFDVNMTITGGYNNTQNITLAAGASTQVTFANWTPAAGSYIVHVCTQLAGDGDPGNDCMDKTVWAYNGAWTSGLVVPAGQDLASGVGYTETVDKTTTGYLFVTGGEPGGTNCYKYNVNTNTWTTIVSLPAYRTRHATAIVGHYLYVIGGADASDVYQSTVYKYDINNDPGGWTAVDSLPVALGWCKAVGYNNHIYLAGGYDGANVLASVYVYDVGLDSWSSATAMPATRFGGAFSITGNTLVYVAGVDASVIYNTVFRGTIDGGNPLLITWTSTAKPFPGDGMQYLNNSSDKNEIASLPKKEIKNSKEKKITDKSKDSPNSVYPPGATFRFDAAPWGSDGIIVACGSKTIPWSDPPSDQCWVYKPGTDTWLKQGNVPIPVTAPALGSVNLAGTWKLIVNGGFTSSTQSTATQIWTDVLSSPLSLGLTAMFSGQCNGVTMNFTKDVTVELHDATTPYALVESKAVTLDLNGLGNPTYTVAVNGIPYYIVIKSSNGLETWSANPQVFSGSSLSYDFTTSASQAYGSNMLLIGTKWCIISGDADQNGTINAVDRSLCWNDRNLVGVYSTDFDGNGTVNALDRSIAWNNRNLSVAKPVLALSPESKGVRQETKDNKDNKGKTKGTYDLKLDSKNAKKVTKNK